MTYAFIASYTHPEIGIFSYEAQTFEDAVNGLRACCEPHILYDPASGGCGTHFKVELRVADGDDRLSLSFYRAGFSSDESGAYILSGIEQSFVQHPDRG